MTDILIIGAGPTGLTLACTLAQRGVAFRIVDISNTPPAGSRGKGIQPRSLELFDDLGIVDQVIANGVFKLPIRYYDDQGHSRVEGLYAEQPRRPDTPYLRPLLTPQWRVEEALRNKLESLGGKVEFGVGLTGLAQEKDGVVATLQGFAGETSVRAGYLVGCDGGKSAVRHLTGISFLGETLETHRMMVGDLSVQGIDRDHWHIWSGKQGFLALCPLPSTSAFQFQASIAPGQESEPSLKAYQRLVNERTRHTDIVLSDLSWMSLWRANIRMVDRYRAGNAFLAGDAAHVHSPAGGQGMNTGIQDAYNLGWKLAAVLGGADAALLDTYQEERLPIAAGVLGLSNEIMATAVAARTIAFRRDEKTLQLDLNYRHSSLSMDMRPKGEGLRAGDRAPDASGLVGSDGTRRMFDLLRGPHPTLIGMGAQWSSVIEDCVRTFAGAVKGYLIVGEPSGPSDYFDQDGHARKAYSDSALFVVRPDKYIGLATAGANSEAISAYLRRLLPKI